MAKNFLGEVRRTQVLEYGPGAIIDFRAGARGGGSVSVVAAGLEHWDRTAKPPFPANRQAISEPRLERRLGVKGFRLPPVDDRDEVGDPKKSWLVGARFPTWLQCPSCNEIKPARKWDKEPGDPSRWCHRCSSGDRRVHAVPTRFVVACENGHLDEFPWWRWLSRTAHKPDCKGLGRMKMENRGSIGLAGLFLVCMECGASVSMEGVFSQDSLRGLGCKGHRPWLGEQTVDCGASPRVLQRGASNLYFPLTVSALSIPPWSDKLQELIGIRWSEVVDATRRDREVLLRHFLDSFQNNLGMTLDEVLDEIERRVAYIDNPERENLRQDEYKNLIEGKAGQPQIENTHTEFEVHQQQVPDKLIPYIAKLAKVVRLREVRALKSFTRIYEPATTDDPGRAKLCDLSLTPLNWLPAVEVRGEGVFIALNEDRVAAWEALPEVCDRARQVDEAFKKSLVGKHGEGASGEFNISARLLLLHSLSHALMKHLSLECGYETASIRERIYDKTSGSEMSGVLIYTSSSDSEGTLGGLARQAEPYLFEPIFIGALESIGWCSSDPLCINGITSTSESYNLAACHSCMLVPETSCEMFNRFLDRMMLIGSSMDGVEGYFEGVSGDSKA
ncbi:MAG: DUF1998 domain-containing protein [Halieaceae bacterium]|nr:DUF1998 domain-containing protein [Halieaceae bacterium]